MNKNEPKCTLPEPPTGHTWQYRGMGWNPGREIAAYLTGWVRSSGDPAYISDATPDGLPENHYWEAVASISLIKELRTELDAAQGIAEALEDRIALLKMKCDNWKETAAQYWNNAQYYRDLVIQCGQAIGKASYTSDDGTTQEDVLCAKVPELVKAMCDPALDVVKPDHTAGGKYRILKAGEMLQLGDEFLFRNAVTWIPVAAFHSALPGQLYRRPVKPEDIDLPDYAAEAKDLLADINKSAPIVLCNTFVDLVIKAAKQ